MINRLLAATGPVDRLERQHPEWLLGGLASVAIIYIAWTLVQFELDVPVSHMMALSGMGFALFGSVLSVGLRRQGVQSIVDTYHLGALQPPHEAEPEANPVDETSQLPPSVEDVCREARRRQQVVSLLTVPFVELVIVVSFLVPIITRSASDLWALFLASVVVAIPAAWFMGGMFANALIPQLLTKRHMQLEVLPRSLDRAGGLGAIGNLLYRQLLTLALIAIHLGLWAGIMLTSDAAAVQQGLKPRWLDIYISLFLVFIVCEFIGALWPVWTLHNRMIEAKSRRLAEARKLWTHIRQREYAMTATPQDQTGPREVADLESLRAEYRNLVDVPTWPLPHFASISIAPASLLSMVSVGLPKVFQQLLRTIDGGG